MPPLFPRIRERKIVQWALAYLAAGWIGLQVISLLVGAFAWPPGVVRILAILLALGFPAALVLAWFHGEKGEQRAGSVEIALLGGLLLLAGVVVAKVGWRASTGSAAAAAPPVRAEQGSIAVLPFLDLSPAHDQAYFSDGLAEELLDVLARLPELHVAGRTSSFTFRDRAVPADSIGRALHVENLLEGSVRREGERVRISAQLVDARTGYTRWSETYDRRLSHVFAVQDEISRAIVGVLQVRLAEGRVQGALARQETPDPEAHDLYLQGLYHFHKRGAADVRMAIDDFRRAVRRDSMFARAWAGLALSYGVLPVFEAGPSDSAAAGTAAAAGRAMALDSTLPEAQLALAMSLGIRMRFREAIQLERRAAALDPSSAIAHHLLGFDLLNFGRTDEGVAELRRAVDLDPFAVTATTLLAEGLLSRRDFAGAEAVGRRALRIDSTSQLGFQVVGLAEAFGGKPAEAVRTLERGRGLHPEDSRLGSLLVLAYAAAGRWDEAERVRADLRRPGADRSSEVDAAFADMVFGDRERLIRILTSRDGQRRFFEHGGYIGCNPRYDPLWSDGRFRTAMSRLGIEPCRLARPWPLPVRDPPSVGSAARSLPVLRGVRRPGGAARSP
ncbi:MAG: hypothetical protein Q8W51_13125 [Candidatus Palauibacterales bacterium]|nr:hypothetical protein [Candidatus Palauibacterales bacterium]MDP2530664.1 hypothetical protein [Candidatus Palauibacterales bacterium]MDP2583381.1 hypothetical protein [Candidatus Palauibacterales bacterium]